MRLLVPSKLLNDALKKVLNVVANRTTMAILNNVLLETKDNQLWLTTSDNEITIVTTIDATVEKSGQTTIPAKKFAQIVGTFPDGIVTLDTNDQLITTISCGRALFKIMGLDPASFPKQIEFDGEQEIILQKLELAKNLRKISYAMSNDPSRVVLNGILLSIRDCTMTTVATDGRRLAMVEKVFDSNKNLIDSDIIMPTKVVNELQKLLESEGEIIIKLSQSYVQFIIPGTILTSKLVDGTYPNYRQVIPASFNNSVILPREEFSEVMNRVSMVLNDGSASVKMKLGNDLMILSAMSAEIGEAEEPITVAYVGDPVIINFNPLFIKEPLKNLECDDLTLRFNDEFKPVVILGDEGFLYVIMPMRG